jgi:hypothetical protein
VVCSRRFGGRLCGAATDSGFSIVRARIRRMKLNNECVRTIPRMKLLPNNIGFGYCFSIGFGYCFSIGFLNMFYKYEDKILIMKQKEFKFVKLSDNKYFVKNQINSVPIKFESKIRYQCASSIITIPVSIVRGLKLKLGDKVIVNVVKDESKENLQTK